MDEAGGFRHGCAGQVLQGHVVQEEVGQFGHGHHLFPEVSHWVVAQIKTGHLWQSGHREGQVWKIRMESDLMFAGVFPPDASGIAPQVVMSVGQSTTLFQTVISQQLFDRLP